MASLAVYANATPPLATAQRGLTQVLELMKQRTVEDPEDANEIETLAKMAGHKALAQLAALKDSDPLTALWRMKTEALGCDPLDSSVPLNLIEQLNQTFTYIASARAARFLLKEHPDLGPYRLNLGTTPGPDIESSRSGGLSAEVFAAVTPQNNQKLRRDIQKVYETNASLKYVFFMCPGYEPGRQMHLSRDGVTVYSLGGAL